MRRSYHLLVLVIILLTFMASVPKLSAQEKAKYITDDGYDAIELAKIKAHLEFLASDLLEGREATTRGYDIAASYGVSIFRQLGLKPAFDGSYLQTFPVVETISTNKAKLQVVSKKGDSELTTEFINRVHFAVSSSQQSTTIDAPVVFAGFGISEKDANYDDYAGIDVKNKIVLIMTHAPGEGDDKSYFYRQDNRNRFFYGQETSEKLRNAQSHGALAVLLINDPLGKHQSNIIGFAENVKRKPNNNLNVTSPRRRMSLLDQSDNDTPAPIPIITVTDAVAKMLLGDRDLLSLQKQINEKVKPVSTELSSTRVRLNIEVENKLLTTSNVVGMIEGSDEQLKKEYIVIGGHLDHDGTRDGYIWNGADDDGSGSTAVLALAEAFSRARVKPKRTILFCLWGAEEKGLLGSHYFTNYPPVPLDKISVMIQLDMIGRDVEPRSGQSENQPKPKDLKKYIYVEIAKQATDPGDFILRAGETAGLELNYEVSPRVSGGSDHFYFWKKKVPIITVDDGVSHPDYHQPSDTVDKINFDKILLVSRMVYLAAREIANNPAMMRWDNSVPIPARP